MGRRSLRFGVPALLLVGSGCIHLPRPAATGNGIWKPDTTLATSLKNETKASNGIEVSGPKIYDDFSLRLMLDQARQRLATLNGLDLASLIAHLGSTTGARIDQTQIGAQVTGSPLPGIATTNTGATSSTTTNAGLPDANTTLPASTTVTTNPTTSSTTTSGGLAPPAPPVVPSGLTFTPPAGVAGSSLDILNEQMQLTYEIANLQLLLEGALSDRFVLNQRTIKPRTTIGFPITLSPQPRYKNASAVVEVEVTTFPENLGGSPPSITALLPREKTYNVATIKDRMTSIGAGAVVGTVGVSGSYVRGHKTYYLVQDQDTVAMQRPADPAKKNSVSFAWEFRPVLGQEFVHGGLKQVFVQLALPLLETAGDCFGTIKVHTYWLEFDRKQGIDTKVIGNSVLATEQGFPIPHYDLTPLVGGVTYEDLGDGTVLVHVRGDYMAGTYVQVGPLRYDQSKGLAIDDVGLKFSVPAAALARWTARVIARNGSEADILNPVAQKPLEALRPCPVLPAAGAAAETSPPPPTSAKVRAVRLAPGGQSVAIELERGVTRQPLPDEVLFGEAPNRLILAESSISGLTTKNPVILAPIGGATGCPYGSIEIGATSLIPLNENDSELKVEFTSGISLTEPVLLEVGGKVFGLKDTTVKRDTSKDGAPVISAVVPNAFLLANRSVRAFVPFYGPCYSKTKQLSELDLDSAQERLVLVSVDKDGTAVYILYGNGLEEAKVLPSGVAELTQVDTVPKGRIVMVKIIKENLAATKKLVLQKKDRQRPLLLDVPPPKPDPPKVTVDSPVIQNTDELEVSVDKVKELKSVKLGDKELKYTVGTGSIRLLYLQADKVTTVQKTQELTFEFQDKTKVTLKFDVVAARIGVK